MYLLFFFFQAEDGIRDKLVTGVQTCALPICAGQDQVTIRLLAPEDIGGGVITSKPVDVCAGVPPAEIKIKSPILRQCHAQLARALPVVKPVPFRGPTSIIDR